MLPNLYLGDFGASLMHVVPILGAALILPYLINRNDTRHRVFLFAVAIVFAIRYAWWRTTETIAPVGWTVDFLASGLLLGLELMAIVSSISAFFILMRYRDRSSDSDLNAGWWEEEPPKVALLIATYNEELEVLERTIIGSKALRHPEKEIMVLDDGRRDWLRDYCEKQGVTYIRRPDNKHAKAGNINHTLQLLWARERPPDYVAVLDADFVPHRGFLSRTLALFHDPTVGLVQTPQHFFNADPIQHNLGISRSYPDEQRFFFDDMQPSRDGWGVAFCCGTSSIMRLDALKDIGGFPTDSITEDYMITLCLQNAGWQTAYLNEPLTEGLAPEGLKEYVTQRSRWCLGMMQIARSRVGPFRKNGLRLRDRWSVIDASLYWITTFPFRVAAMVFPLLYWYGNITVVDASPADVVTYFGCFFVWNLMAINLMSRGNVVPILTDVSQLLGALPITRAAFVGLVQPRGHPFSVTAKGGDRSRIVVQWNMLAPFAILLGLTVIGLLLGLVTDRFAFNDAGEGKWVILFWTIYNMIVLTLTIIACVELPRRERHVADTPERITFKFGSEEKRMWVTSLTQNTARLRGGHFDVGTYGKIDLPGVGELPVFVLAQTADGMRVELMPDEEQRDALFMRFYTEDNTPGISVVDTWNMLGDMARRISRISRDKTVGKGAALDRKD